MDYAPEMCQPSLDILSRSVFIMTDPDRCDDETTALIKTIRAAAE